MALPWHKEFSVRIYEYSSASLKSPNNRAIGVGAPNRALNFSFFRLTVAVAKSVLIRSPTSVDLLKEVRAALYMLDATVDVENIALRAVPSFRRKYRDFSQTARTGELAQGASFVFAQEVLGYPLVLDFVGFLRSQGIPAMPSGLKEPDFALLFKDAHLRPCLLKSKGSCPPKKTNAVKSKLREALEQCTTGEAHLAACAASVAAKNTYGTLLRLAETTDAWPSVFAYADPPGKGRNDMPYPQDAARRYYAAFFAMLGHRLLAASLMRTQPDRTLFENRPTREFGGRLYFAFSAGPGSPFAAVRRFKREPFRSESWFMQRELLLALVDEDATKLIEILGSFSDIRLESSDTVVTFKDGTIYAMPETVRLS